MTRITIDIEREMTEEEILKAQEVFTALVVTGAIFGVRGGSANVHFDGECIFQGIELNYWPWRRRKPAVKTEQGLDRRGLWKSDLTRV